MNERDSLKINNRGHLEIGGMDAVEIVKRFGTPVYVFDEKHIRDMMSIYRDTIQNEYDGNGMVLYASKAFSCKAIYKIANQERIGVDVVSGGELYTALAANFPPDKIYFHGNNKQFEELDFALKSKVGCIVIDSFREADILNDLAEKHNVKQNVLIRINPGVEAHTHAFIQTARTDSKFGFSVSGGSAESIISHILNKENLRLKGYHCHIGSQIFENQSFALAAEKMIAFIAEIKEKYGFEAETLNLGGGFGIWYNDEDPKLKIEDYKRSVQNIISTIKEKTVAYNLKQPFLLIEPGRSIVGEAGITLYTVGAIRDIVGIKKYVAIDGGMFENPRYALYQSRYSVMLANRADEECTERITVAGKCCESGDIIATEVAVPKPQSGDILAVFSTGAYNYSMASNYNRNSVPPAILVKDGKAEYIIKPQSYEDIIRNDVVPDYLK